MSTTIDRSAPAEQRIKLAISGMTCAARIERKLGKLEGVTATVNYATEKAQVTYPEGLDPQQLVDQVGAAGYTAALPPAQGAPPR